MGQFAMTRIEMLIEIIGICYLNGEDETVIVRKSNSEMKIQTSKIDLLAYQYNFFEKLDGYKGLQSEGQ